MPGYDYELNRAAFLGVLACEDRDIVRLSLAIELLAENPGRAADFHGYDFRGHAVPWMKVGNYALAYLPDHTNKIIHILDIRRILE